MPSLSQEPAPGSRDRSGHSGGPGDGPRIAQRLLSVLAEVQSDIIRGTDSLEAMRRLLKELLALTGSEALLLAESRTSGTGTPPLLRRVISLPPEDLEEAWRPPLPREGPGAAARELRSLVETVCATDAAVQTAAPGARRPLLGLPLEIDGACVGALAIAGRPDGYDAEFIELLRPVVRACASFLWGWRNEQRRSQAEQEMRQQQQQSAERLRLVMDNIQDGVWDLDLLTGDLHANPRWLGMLGYGEGELAVRLETWMDLRHPEDVGDFDAAAQAHLDGHSPLFESEQRLRHRDGRWMWVLTRAKVVTRDAQGKALRMIGTNVDITQRKLGEQRLQTLVDVLPDLVFRMGADGTYLDHYDKNDVELALPRQQVLGSNIRQLPIPPETIQAMQAHLDRALQSGQVDVIEYMMQLTQGPQYYELRSMRTTSDELISIVRNITERKLAEFRILQQEEELRRHRDSLEELVRIRSEKLLRATLDLEEQQAQLVQSEKMASLGQMAAGVAHEINNPVSYVMSNLGTLDQYVSAALLPLLRIQRTLLGLEDAEAGASAPELLERMQEIWQREDVDYLLTDMPQLIEESLGGTRRIKEIVQSLRSFAREDTGEPQLVDVNEELASTLKIVWNELKYKCEVKRDFGPLPLVSCHPTQISQVFTNLLVNAAQAIETRGEIRIRTRQEGSEVVVEIADTGKGMSQETLTRLFTPFFTTKPRGQGTGLGLSVSYGIIARHQGRIDVQSEPGKGSTFTIRLPATHPETHNH
jgi:two-component system, NtrC family, sensor kinase